jgi:hypothetical protein
MKLGVPDVLVFRQVERRQPPINAHQAFARDRDRLIPDRQPASAPGFVEGPLMGNALILLGLNATRSMRGKPTRRLTTMLGLAALFSGGLLLASAALPLPIEIPVLEALLIGLGGVLIARELVRVRRSA